MRVACLALLLVCACHNPLGPIVSPLDPEVTLFRVEGPDGPYMLETHRRAADEITATWYAAAERCAQREGMYAEIRWYVAETTWPGQTGLIHGEFRVPNVIILNAREANDSALIVHEALHHILWRSGYEGDPHPIPPFGTCAKAQAPLR